MLVATLEQHDWSVDGWRLEPLHGTSTLNAVPLLHPVGNQHGEVLEYCRIPERVIRAASPSVARFQSQRSRSAAAALTSASAVNDPGSTELTVGSS